MGSPKESDTTVHTHTFTQNIHIGNYKQIMFGVVCAWLDIFERSYCVLNFLFILYFDCAASSVLHGLLPSCGARASHVAASLVCRAQALGLAGFSSCSSRLQSTASAVVTHGLNCSAACEIFPDQGSNPCLLHRQADSSPLSQEGSPRAPTLKKNTVFKPFNVTE